MKHFILNPHWSLKIFASLCFSQVKEQLPENLTYYNANPPGFICGGQFFIFIHMSSFTQSEGDYSASVN